MRIYILTKQATHDMYGEPEKPPTIIGYTTNIDLAVNWRQRTRMGDRYDFITQAVEQTEDSLRGK